MSTLGARGWSQPHRKEIDQQWDGGGSPHENWVVVPKGEEWDAGKAKSNVGLLQRRLASWKIGARAF